MNGPLQGAFPRPVSRRTLLQAGGALALGGGLAGLLAACGSSSSKGSAAASRARSPRSRCSSAI